MGLLILATTPTVGLSHQNHAHSDPTMPSPTDAAVLQLINSAYLRDVKPIFQRKCFDCHSDQTRYPWYSNLPGAKQLIQNDIQEAKKHLDFSPDFPFKGHGTPSEDLKEILRSVKAHEMPPLRYRVLHWGSGMSDAEISLIQQWVRESQRLLNAAVTSK